MINIDAAKTIMHPLCRRWGSGDDKLREVIIKNGYAYACDGHILLRCTVGTADGRTYDSNYNDYPKEYPVGSFNGLLHGRKVKKWMALPTDSIDWHNFVAELTKEVERKKIIADQEHVSRYTIEECPCCGETVYYDKEECKLVEQVDIKMPEDIDYRDALLPVEVGIDGEYILVNFAYLWAAYMVLGKFEVGKDEFGCLAIRKGDARGCILPLNKESCPADCMPNVLDCEQTLDKPEAVGGAK